MMAPNVMPDLFTQLNDTPDKYQSIIYIISHVVLFLGSMIVGIIFERYRLTTARFCEHLIKSLASCLITSWTSAVSLFQLFASKLTLQPLKTGFLRCSANFCQMPALYFLAFQSFGATQFKSLVNWSTITFSNTGIPSCYHDLCARTNAFSTTACRYAVAKANRLTRKPASQPSIEEIMSQLLETHYTVDNTQHTLSAIWLALAQHPDLKPHFKAPKITTDQLNENLRLDTSSFFNHLEESVSEINKTLAKEYSFADVHAALMTSVATLYVCGVNEVLARVHGDWLKELGEVFSRFRVYQESPGALAKVERVLIERLLRCLERRPSRSRR